MKNILIRGARTHNLKNLNLSIPRDQLTVITGLSGSGKSSLAFDTLYAEGQRRYVESLSAYARQFLSMMEKPEVDHIEGLSPAISIEQKSTSHNPRSTVGTITEIYDYLRLLFARAGDPVCPKHGVVLAAQTISQMVDAVLEYPDKTRFMILAPVVQNRKGEHLELLQGLRAQGFLRAKIDGRIVELDSFPNLDKNKKHTIEVVVDRLRAKSDFRLRFAESFETSLRLADSSVKVAFLDDEKRTPLVFSAKFACTKCGYSLSELTPRLFSFNSPQGACAECDGLGIAQHFDPERIINSNLTLAEGAIRGWDSRYTYYSQLLASLAKHYKFSLDKTWDKLTKKIQKIILHGSRDELIDFEYQNGDGRGNFRTDVFEGVIPNMQRRYRETTSEPVRQSLSKFLVDKSCDSCNGTRLCESARNVLIAGTTLPEIVSKPVGEAKEFFEKLSLPGQRAEIVSRIRRELVSRLSFLVNVGLDYLSLDRSAETLSGGEAQRIRLASQIGAGLVGVMYILDEPSIGLHQRDNAKLLKTLYELRDMGNTVIVVEHDEEAIRTADHVLDLGPGAGVHGGEIVAEGAPDDIINHQDSLTGKYLSGRMQIDLPNKRRLYNSKKILSLVGASGNNLGDITVDFPIGLLTCVTGVSGSGKSTLVNDTLAPLAATELNGATIREASAYKSITGLDHLDKVVEINQSPIGRTPRSNPATYTGLFTAVRELFAGTREARSRGYTAGRFSFNVKGGRCEACQGDGVIRVEMHFLADVYVTCDICQGKRYNRETLEINYKGKNIEQVLEMTVEDARKFFDPVPAIARKLQTLLDVGLSYICLGQSATTLSGGEAQRIKLSRELSKRDTGNTLYILDEPTTGLHFHDVRQLLEVLHRLCDAGNTIVVIEHNLDVIKTADWIIDLGPEGGLGGGQIVAVGTPEAVIKHKSSYTGKYLKKVIQNQIKSS